MSSPSPPSRSSSNVRIPSGGQRLNCPRLDVGIGTNNIGPKECCSLPEVCSLTVLGELGPENMTRVESAVLGDRTPVTRPDHSAQERALLGFRDNFRCSNRGGETAIPSPLECQLRTAGTATQQQREQHCAAHCPAITCQSIVGGEVGSHNIDHNRQINGCPQRSALQTGDEPSLWSRISSVAHKSIASIGRNLIPSKRRMTRQKKDFRKEMKALLPDIAGQYRPIPWYDISPLTSEHSSEADISELTDTCSSNIRSDDNNISEKTSDAFSELVICNETNTLEPQSPPKTIELPKTVESSPHRERLPICPERRRQVIDSYSKRLFAKSQSIQNPIQNEVKISVSVPSPEEDILDDNITSNDVQIKESIDDSNQMSETDFDSFDRRIFSTEMDNLLEEFRFSLETSDANLSPQALSVTYGPEMTIEGNIHTTGVRSESESTSSSAIRDKSNRTNDITRSRVSTKSSKARTEKTDRSIESNLIWLTIVSIPIPILTYLTFKR